MEWKGERGGIAVLDDYGHHPTEIRATLQALQERFPNRRSIVLFQPHRYTRTQQLAEAFAQSFAGVHHVGLLDIYAAGESPLPGVTSDSLAERFRANKVAVTRLRPDGGEEQLRSLVRPGDVVLTLGAGDVWKWGERLLTSLDPVAS
jgi:UDP-N-acetylmuramate--alanine ligase